MLNEAARCVNRGCPLAAHCQRRLPAQGDRVQYARFTPQRNPNGIGCEGFIPFGKPDFDNLTKGMRL